MQRPSPPPAPEDDAPARRYQRQALFAPLGAAGDERLRCASVLIVGCGALGSHAAGLLARAGIGRLRLVDRDVVEWTNLHRQDAFTEADAREARPKANALAAHLREANREIEIEGLAADFNPANAVEIGRGADLFIDGTDNLPARYLLNDLALETRTPWVYGGAVGEEARAQLFLPGAGPCLRCLIPEMPPPGTLPTCDAAGVLGPAAAAAASLQAALALRALARPEGAAALAGRLVRLRLWDIDAGVHGPLARDPSCPACVAGRRDFLRGGRGDAAAVLCGRASVQVLPEAAGRTLDLEALAAKLAPLGSVERSPWILRFRPSGSAQRLTLFPDARAIVDGTRDPGIARSLYDRFVGR